MKADGTEPLAATREGHTRIALVGFMRAGKSTVAQRLARKLVWNYLDTDALVVRHTGRSITEIFARDGETAFREAETHVLRQALQKPRTVLALGGGAFVADINRELLAGRATTIWLRLDFETCLDRQSGSSPRPLLEDVDAARQLFQAREPIYGRADLTVDARRQPDEIAAEIARRVMPAN